MLKLARQALRLGALWVAICTSLAGMLVYTKSGLEALLADFNSAPQQKAAPAAPARAPRGL